MRFAALMGGGYSVLPPHAKNYNALTGLKFIYKDGRPLGRPLVWSCGSSAASRFSLVLSQKFSILLLLRFSQFVPVISAVSAYLAMGKMQPECMLQSYAFYAVETIKGSFQTFKQFAH